ncbi:redoxin domain-containing protein [Paenibacillus sp. LMG 31458]|uniref:thioredoxin-dependent peroxiredoxin n=1 Tax=Paenibacillus phytorum TaxID=2654977 RepID=A0ABX1XUX0_9BACL|nr:peroxiredoxin-like family protein [Paenibacillus phytorum]NOU71841.1 redoxin domain-containing protein [Paenibacillus phytorum]
MSDELNKRLAEREETFKSESPAEYEILQQSIVMLEKGGAAPGLSIGDLAPDFTLTDALGKPMSLMEAVRNGPVILTFYRGGWCPYCSLQLRAYNEMLPQFRELGASLIAVSPQSPDNALSQHEKEGLDFVVASDTDSRVAEQYRVLYEVSGSLKALYEKIGLDLASYNSADQWFLPVSATFVIDRDARIHYAYVDPNFMRRLEPEVILRVLKTL